MLLKQDDIVTRPSMLLGSLNMSPIEINQLYIPIANKGVAEKSHAITRVVSGSGETLWQFQALEQQIISTQAAYLLDFSLNKVTKRAQPMIFETAGLLVMTTTF